MSNSEKIHPNKTITVQVEVNAPLTYCWKLWTSPDDVLLFNNPFDNWHTAKVDFELKSGGRFYYRMEAKDESAGFDFAGTFGNILTFEKIEQLGDDGRKTEIIFKGNVASTIIMEIFEPDENTPLDLQARFCQGILNSFKTYAEKRITPFQAQK